MPLAANPPQCFNEITPNGMESNSTCAASGAFLLFGGFAGVMWVFLRSVSLHLQICWQVTVGHKFMWLAQGVGWGVPLVGVVVAMVLSGVSFRFGATCHINHKLSLEDFWIPLLIFAGLTVIISFATFGYCIKVYLASLADNGPSTEGSGMPSYSNSIRTLTPRQAYKRVRRVIALQWRGITIVLIIVMDVIFFSVVFVFQDATVSNVKEDPSLALDWITCLTVNRGNKDVCLDKSDSLVIPQATAVAVLILLAVSLECAVADFDSESGRLADTNCTLVQRNLAPISTRTMVYGHSMDRSCQVARRPAKERVCFSRCSTRLQERYTFVRDAQSGFRQNFRLTSNTHSRTHAD